MADLPGGADEVIRIRWISEFVDESKGLQASMVRARQAFDQAAKDQAKNHRLTMQSAKETALGMKQADEAQRARLVRLRELSATEYRTETSRLATARKLQGEEDRLARDRITREKKVTKAISDERVRRKAVIEKETLDARQQANAQLEAERDRIKGEIGALRTRNKELQVEKTTRGTTRERKAEIENEKALNRLEIDAIQNGKKQRLAALEKSSREENKVITATRRERIRGMEKDIKTDFEPKVTSQFDNLIDKRISRIDELRSKLTSLEAAQKELASLRTEFPQGIEAKVRSFRPGDAERGALMAQKQMLRAEREQQYALQRLDKSLARVRYEFQTTGHVSEEAFTRVKNSSELASRAGVDFERVTRDAGLSIRGFNDHKQREIRLLRTNEDSLGRNTNQMGRFSRALRQMKDGLRLSTNEMILFSRTIHLLTIPVLATAVSVLAQALTTAAGGATALVGALSPLVGQVAGIAPLAFSAAQGFTVWRIALTNLGQSSLSVGKIIQTSLSASTDQFQLMLKNLPATAQNFAVKLRYSLFPAFDKLRTELQNKLFPAIFDAIKFASPAFKGFDKILVGTASAFGNLIRQVGGRLGSPAFAKDLAIQGRETNKWVRQLTPAVLHLMDAFRNLAVAADPLIQHFVRLINSFSRWIDIQATYGRQSGNLQRFFRQSNRVLDTTLSLFGNLGQALINIGKIATRVLGAQMLRDLRGQTVALRAWTESAKGSATIARYFQDLKKPLYEAGKLARDLFKAFFQITNNSDFFTLLQQLRTQALPALVEMFQSVNKNFAPALINLLTSVIKTISALGESGGLGNLVKALTLISDAIRKIAQSPIGPIIFRLLGFVAIFRTLRFAAAISGVSLLTRNFYALGRAIAGTAVEASTFNRFLAGRGLARFNPGQTAIIGGAPLTPVAAFGRSTGGFTTERSLSQSAAGRGGFITLPSAAFPGASVKVPLSQDVLQKEIQAQQMARERSFLNLVRRNADLASGAGGVGLTAAGLLVGGRTGSILTGAGIGATLGAPFGGVGAVPGFAIGATVGALTGFVTSIKHAGSALDKMADAALRTSEQTGNARQRVQTALQDIRGAANARDEARLNLVQQEKLLEKMRRTPGQQGQVEQQVFAVRDAKEAFRQAQGRLSQDKETLRQFLPTLLRGSKTFLNELLGGRSAVIANTRQDVAKIATSQPGEAFIRALTNRENSRGWIKFLDHLKETSKDQKIVKIADTLERIQQDSKKLTSKRQIVEIEMKLFGDTKQFKELLDLAQIGAVVTPKGINKAAPQGRAYGGRIPGMPVSADTVPAMLSPGEFVVTGDGERLLEGLTGIPGVLDYVGSVQRPHFNTGGRVRRFASGGRPGDTATPFDFEGVAADALRSALGGGSFDDLVQQAIDSATSAMAGMDTSPGSSSSVIPKGTPGKLRGKMQRMLADAAGWMGRGVLSAPGVGLGIKGRFLQASDFAKSKINHKTGLDPGAVISDIIRAGYGTQFPDVNPNQLGNVLQQGKSKYVTVWLRRGAAQEYDARIKIGSRGFGFSGGKFTRADIGSSGAGGVNYLPFHIPGWPLRKGGRVGFAGGGFVTPEQLWQALGLTPKEIAALRSGRVTLQQIMEHHRSGGFDIGGFFSRHFGHLRNYGLLGKTALGVGHFAKRSAVGVGDLAKRFALGNYYFYTGQQKKSGRIADQILAQQQAALEASASILAHPGRNKAQSALALLGLFPTGRFLRAPIEELSVGANLKAIAARKALGTAGLGVLSEEERAHDFVRRLSKAMRAPEDPTVRGTRMRRPHVENALERFNQRITHDDVPSGALFSYTGPFFGRINEIMRSKMDLTDPFYTEARYNAEDLAPFLESSRLKRRTVLFRGVGPRGLSNLLSPLHKRFSDLFSDADVLRAMMHPNAPREPGLARITPHEYRDFLTRQGVIGKSFQPGYFLSSTIDRATANDFGAASLIIDAKKGTRGFYTGNRFSENTSEREFIFSHKQPFRVAGIEVGKRNDPYSGGALKDELRVFLQTISNAEHFARTGGGGLGLVGHAARPNLRFGNPLNKLLASLLGRRYMFHGTTSDSGYGIQRDRQIVSSSELLRRAGNPSGFGLKQAYAGEYDIASRFIGRSPGAKGSIAFVRRKDLPLGQRMTSEIFRSTSPIPVRGVAHGVSSDMSVSRVYAKYLAQLLKDLFHLRGGGRVRFQMGGYAPHQDLMASPLGMAPLFTTPHQPPMRRGGRLSFRSGGRVGYVPFRDGGPVRRGVVDFETQKIAQEAAEAQKKRDMETFRRLAKSIQDHNSLLTERILAAAAAIIAQDNSAANQAATQTTQKVQKVKPQVIPGGLSVGGDVGGGGDPYGIAAQARERISLVNFANNVKNDSAKALGGMAKGIESQLKSLGNALNAAELAGNQNQANKIQTQITLLESKLQIVMDAVGNIVNKLTRRIAQSAARLTELQSKLEFRLTKLGVDPAGLTALTLTQRELNQAVKEDRLQLRLAKRQLAALKAAGAPQDVIDQYVQAVQAARQTLRSALGQQILGLRSIARRKFERNETRAAVQEQLAELRLQNVQTQAQIAGAYDGGAGASAAYINSTVIPALQKQIAAVQATLDHAKKLKLTEDEKNQKLIELQELNNTLAQYQLEAQQNANALLAKTLGKLTFEFNGQTFSDMIGSGTGI